MSVDLTRPMEEIRAQGAQWVLVTDGAKPALALGPPGCETFGQIAEQVFEPLWNMQLVHAAATEEAE